MKKLFVISIAIAVLSGCNNEGMTDDNVNEGETNSDTEDFPADNTDENIAEELDSEETDIENVENEQSIETYSLEDLEGTYILTGEDERVRVVLDEGVLRYTDGRGNVRYRLSDSGDRLVLAGEDPSVYMINKNDLGFELTNIDEDGKATGNNLKLEIME